MTDFWIKKLGSNRGKPRIYLDGLQAIRAGFMPGERFDVVIDDKRVVLQKNADGSRVVSQKVRGDVQYPVIDINSADLLKMFDGMDAVRLVVQEDRVFLLPLASEAKKVERLNRLTAKLQAGEPLSAGSLAHGGGVLASAIHRGLRDAGVQCNMVFANEIRDDLMLHAIEHNEVWGEKSAAIALPLQEAAQDDYLMQQLPKIEVLEMGLPCSGASKAGKAKRGNVHMEGHPEVGHLVVSALMVINKTQPAVVLLENVTDYAHSASADILRNQFRDMGYDTHEAVLSGQDYGVMEDRVRWCMVATTRGMTFNFDMLTPPVRAVRTLGEVLDRTIGPGDERWREVTYLKEKRERDEAKGSNFKMQYIYEDSTLVPTLRKAYFKGGSTDPRLVHPTDPNLSRLLTAEEHARIKGVPTELIEDLSQSNAHQLLGQGIVYAPFRAVGQRIGESLLRLTDAHAQELLADDESDAIRSRQRMTG